MVDLCSLPCRYVLITGNPFQICDGKLRVKQSVTLAGQLKGISVSSHNDFTFVLHVAPGDGDDKQRSKGDIILLSERYGALCAALSLHFLLLF